jgi:hypothetical protein
MSQNSLLSNAVGSYVWPVALALSILTVVSAFAWRGLYTVVPASDHESHAMYRVNRLTGAVSFCSGARCIAAEWLSRSSEN